VEIDDLAHRFENSSIALRDLTKEMEHLAASLEERPTDALPRNDPDRQTFTAFILQARSEKH
jgi:hypothetical protein